MVAAQTKLASRAGKSLSFEMQDMTHPFWLPLSADSLRQLALLEQVMVVASRIERQNVESTRMNERRLAFDR